MQEEGFWTQPQQVILLVDNDQNDEDVHHLGLMLRALEAVAIRRETHPLFPHHLTCLLCESSLEPNCVYEYDRTWRWPSSLLHYVLDHRVRVSQPFYSMLVAYHTSPPQRTHVVHALPQQDHPFPFTPMSFYNNQQATTTSSRREEGFDTARLEGFFGGEVIPVIHQLTHREAKEIADKMQKIESDPVKVKRLHLQNHTTDDDVVCVVCGQSQLVGGAQTVFERNGLRWPHSYQHYVRFHEVQPSRLFIDMLRNCEEEVKRVQGAVVSPPQPPRWRDVSPVRVFSPPPQNPAPGPPSLVQKPTTPQKQTTNPFSCYNGHEMKLVVARPSTYRSHSQSPSSSRWICDVCQETIPDNITGFDNAVLHCGLCKYDVCNSCRGLDVTHDPTKRCPSGHQLHLQHGVPTEYSSGRWQCDWCEERLSIQERNVLHCHVCQYDVCSLCYTHEADHPTICTQCNSNVGPMEYIKAKPVQYEGGGWYCDYCKEEIVTDVSGHTQNVVMHCSRCRFDVCHRCRNKIPHK
eukprot:PhF_6_TR40980/c0_g1_i4/m.62062